MLPSLDSPLFVASRDLDNKTVENPFDLVNRDQSKLNLLFDIHLFHNRELQAYSISLDYYLMRVKQHSQGH